MRCRNDPLRAAASPRSGTSGRRGGGVPSVPKNPLPPTGEGRVGFDVMVARRLGQHAAALGACFTRGTRPLDLDAIEPGQRLIDKVKSARGSEMLRFSGEWRRRTVRSLLHRGSHRSLNCETAPAGLGGFQAQLSHCPPSSTKPCLGTRSMRFTCFRFLRSFPAGRATARRRASVPQK